MSGEIQLTADMFRKEPEEPTPKAIAEFQKLSVMLIDNIKPLKEITVVRYDQNFITARYIFNFPTFQEEAQIRTVEMEEKGAKAAYDVIKPRIEERIENRKKIPNRATRRRAVKLAKKLKAKRKARRKK
jgi:hypothetical protein